MSLSAGEPRRGRAWLQEAAERWFKPFTVAITFLVGLAVTINAWHGAHSTVDATALHRFDSRVEDTRDAIRDRMLDYAQVLRGAAGLFAGSDNVTREEWRRYVNALQVELSYPGIQALGVAYRVLQSELGAHESSMREDGPRDYAIRPPGARAEYFPVVYIEPPTERNLRARGFDLYSEGMRRAAIQRARDSGEPAVSGKLTLVEDQGNKADAQPGFLMFLPVYRNGMPADIIDDRRANSIAIVYAPFRTRDLMRGLLGALGDLRVEVFDGATTAPESLLYDSAPPGAVRTPAYTKTSELIVQDRVWTLRATSLPAFEQGIDRSRPNMTLVAGIAICLTLTALVWVLATLRERALRLAQRMTAQLRESRERLSLALEGSDLALFDLDVMSGTVTLSPLWNAMLGGKPAVTITSIESLEAIVHPDDRPHLKNALVATLKGEAECYDVEHRVRTHEGAWKWIASHAKVSERDASGRACRITGTNADISERKAVESLKNEFIGTVSHELRTPLTALIGALSLLREEYGEKAPPDAAMFLDMAFQNGERLAALVNDILDLEKVESGKLDLDIERIDLGPCLDRAVSLNSAYAEKHGTRFVLEPVELGLCVHADSDRLLQVVTNLLSNAAKFSPAGEPVRVTACALADIARIEIADRGPGVPPEFRHRIFSKFAQAESGSSKGGTGLGLAISKAIVEAMHGRIGYDDGAAVGATFYIELPLAREGEDPEKRHRPDRRKGDRRKTPRENVNA
ncbi:MAG TPA: CHASE domain-containing protein [Burkholderiales bacterium]|nr:CHASE domain-containing protein [Burkholderiales bacterium]